MKNIIIGMIFLIGSISCERKCSIDEEAKLLFQNCISTVENYSIKDTLTMSKYEHGNTCFFLYLLTGHRASHVKGDWDFLSIDTIQKKRDIFLWKEWYEHNKCELTVEHFDKIYQDKIIDTADIFNYYLTLEEFLESGLVIKRKSIEEETIDSMHSVIIEIK